MDKSFNKYLDATEYAQMICDILQHGDIFAEDLIKFEKVDDKIQFRVTAEKLVKKLNLLLENPLVQRYPHLSNQMMPDLREICPIEGLDFKMSIRLPKKKNSDTKLF